MTLAITLLCEAGQILPPGEYVLGYCADLIFLAGFEL